MTQTSTNLQPCWFLISIYLKLCHYEHANDVDVQKTQVFLNFQVKKLRIWRKHCEMFQISSHFQNKTEKSKMLWRIKHSWKIKDFISPIENKFMKLLTWCIQFLFKMAFTFQVILSWNADSGIMRFNRSLTQHNVLLLGRSFIQEEESVWWLHMPKLFW